MLISHPQQGDARNYTLSVQVETYIKNTEGVCGEEQPRIPYLLEDASQSLLLTSLLDKYTAATSHLHQV